MSVKLQVLSDLHIDSYNRRGLPVGEIPVTNCDAIIIAGDTANDRQGIDWLINQAHRLQKPIFVIAGNHDYYGSDIHSYDDTFRELTKDTGVKFLQCDSVDFMGIRLIGTTLWTDFSYQANENTLIQAITFMRDYQEIYQGNRLFLPTDSIALHQKQRAWLKQQLQQAKQDNIPAVVITHHSISPNSVSEKYKNFSSNAGFVSDFSEWLKADFAPELWIHGHTHEAFDYIQANTRVVVNPRAYPNEVSSTAIEFDWSKVVSVA